MPERRLGKDRQLTQVTGCRPVCGNPGFLQLALASSLATSNPAIIGSAPRCQSESRCDRTNSEKSVTRVSHALNRTRFPRDPPPEIATGTNFIPSEFTNGRATVASPTLLTDCGPQLESTAITEKFHQSRRYGVLAYLHGFVLDVTIRGLQQDFRKVNLCRCGNAGQERLVLNMSSSPNHARHSWVVTMCSCSCDPRTGKPKRRSDRGRRGAFT